MMNKNKDKKKVNPDTHNATSFEFVATLASDPRTSIKNKTPVSGKKVITLRSGHVVVI